MIARFALAFLSLTVFVTAVQADTTIVDEDFEGYANQAAFNLQWNADFGDGRFDVSAFGEVARLVPDIGNPDITPPNDNPPGIQGKAAAIISLITEFNNTANPGVPDDPAFEIAPSASESVHFGADLFDDNDLIVGTNGNLALNKKLTVALRNDTIERDPGVFGTNFIELGFWNGETFDPTDPANAPPNTPTLDQPATDFGYRIQLFGAASGALVRNPDWQFFPLDLALDIDDQDGDTVVPTPDGLVSSVDIGPGWHRWEATITPTDVTLTLDLFRDGKINLTRDGNGDIEVGVGADGFDSVVTWEIEPNNFDTGDAFDYDPFTSLRFGVPSGSGGGITESVIDNVNLTLVDVAAAANDADFDGDLLVDGGDFLTWQRNFGTNTGLALNTDGDANGDGNVLGDDLTVWQTQFGGPPPLAGLATIPEPTTAILALLACAGPLLAVRRRN